MLILLMHFFLNYANDHHKSIQECLTPRRALDAIMTIHCHNIRRHRIFFLKYRNIRNNKVNHIHTLKVNFYVFTQLEG